MRIGRLIWTFALLAGFAIGAAPVTTSSVHADSWAMPTVQTYQSANGDYRFTVTPRPIRSQLDYFKAKVAEEQGKAPPPAGSAMGQLERKGLDGKWQTVWIAPLRNEVAPVRVLVSDDGSRVVTFDDWHGTGYGPNVVAIYGAAGELVKAFALADLVPESYIEALPHSVSSIQWSGQHRLAGSTLLLQVRVPSPQRNIEQYMPIEIDLATGAEVQTARPGWEGALAAAEQVNAAALAAQIARKKYMTEPLVGPVTRDERGWHEYLREAYQRLTPDRSDYASTWTTVLRDPLAPDYLASEKWVFERIAEQAKRSGDDAAFATVGPPENLIAVLGKAISKVPKGRLSRTTLYVAVDREHLQALKAALAPSGAQLVWLDPASAIPQRPERIPGSPEEAAARKARNERILGSAIDAEEGT